jgi:hypothetical protein
MTAFLNENPDNLDCSALRPEARIYGKVSASGTKSRKFSATSQDRLFVAVFYTSDLDKIMRYVDEVPTAAVSTRVSSYLIT